MKCPYCNNNLIEGYVTTSAKSSLFWTLEKCSVFEAPANMEGSLQLDDGKFSNVIKGSSVPAKQCKDCKKIIIDLSTYTQRG